MVFGKRNVALAAVGSMVAAQSLPCDIYESGGTPCVAAHSTTRALYADFDGPLYEVTRNSDGATLNIFPLSAGGVANAAQQDDFCTSSTCVITTIYDQSPYGNDITRSAGGNFAGPNADRSDEAAGAVGAPVTLNGQKAYGVFVSPGVGYRNNNANGTATGDDPEGIYAVLDGTHYNGGCCFDYGNAETSSTDTGNGHMEAVYFGDNTVWGSGSGNGPWIMADLENGLFSGYDPKQNTADPSQSARFITGMVKGEPNQWAIRGGVATSGSLSTYYSGIRPSGYQPMYKEGAILLGIGGDNSNGAQGTWYEGVMTTGYPSDETENAVQANIVAAGYAAGELNSGNVPSVGSTISFHVTTPGYTARYIAHSGDTVNTQVVNTDNTTAEQQTASWTVQTGLADSDCFSFESVDTPGSYIRHYAFELYLNENDGSVQFGEDATFCFQSGLNGQGESIRSWSYPMRYFRHYENVGYAASQGGPEFFDNTYSYANDVSFLIEGTSFDD